MKWFDKEELKDRETLTPNQIDYLLEPSLTTCAFFNCIIRKQYDNVVASAVLVAGGIYLTLIEEIGLLSIIFLLMNSLLQAWLTYFFIKHGRRLAWNRNQWKSFEVFEKSEARWYNLAIASLVMILIRLFGEIQSQTDGLEIAFIVVASLITVCSILLPFFQAWRTKRKSPLSPAAPL